VKVALSILEISQPGAETQGQLSAMDIGAREIVSMHPLLVHCLTDNRQISARAQKHQSVQGRQAQQSPSARERAELADVVLR
jgi:hypothetical protein